MAQQIFELCDLSGAGSPEFFATVNRALANVAVKLVEDEIEVTEVRTYMTAEDMGDEMRFADKESMLFPRYYFHGEHGDGFSVTPVEVEGLDALTAVPEGSCVMKADIYFEMVKALRSAITELEESGGNTKCTAVEQMMRNALIKATGE